MAKTSGAATIGGRVRKAAAGQPAIVREAMLEGGVSPIRYNLTPKERRQLGAARRKGLITPETNSLLPMRSRRLVVSPRVMYGE